jgi:hypothetical protein
MLLFSVVSNVCCFGQLLDFDSLYTHNPQFKSAIQARTDFKDIFTGNDLMKVSIESDFKNLVKRKFKGEYQEATLRYFINDTVQVVRNIRIKPRGNMRRQTCYFPPLMLNFPKKEAVLEQVNEFDKMKMVLDCKRGETYEQYLLSEYYAYKLYNLITPYSYRVRLVQMTLLDTNDKFKTMTSYAYLIENIDQVAKRLNAIPVETESIRDQLTELTTLSYVNMFQYLIGNTDWSVPARHNTSMIKSTDPNLPKPYVIPYDFDYAGIVNTMYAVPDERLGIPSVRERVYRGVCVEEKYVRDAAKKFIESKAEIYELYNKSLLDKNNLRSTIEYLDEFYEIVESEGSLKRNIIESCRH